MTNQINKFSDLPKNSGIYITNLGRLYFNSSDHFWMDELGVEKNPKEWEDEINPKENDKEFNKMKNDPGGYRYNSGKLDWALIDFDSISELVKVLEFGAKKYARGNWMKGLKFNDTINSIIRHLIKFKETGNNDEESGLNHMGHIMANAMFLMHMIKNKKGLDDRNLPQNEEKK